MFNPMPITKQEKIDIIYKKIARKDIDLWCKIKLKTGVINTAVWKPAWSLINCLFFRQIRLDNIGEIIGHPVMIGDVIDYINEDISMGAGYDQVFYHSWESVVDTIKLWEEKRKPIEEQSDKCINFIYSLISK